MHCNRYTTLRRYGRHESCQENTVTVDMNTVHVLFMYKLEDVWSKVCKIILRGLSAFATKLELQLVESKIYHRTS